MKKIIAACMSVLMMCCGVSASAYTAPAAYEQQEIADIAADLQAFLHKSGLDYYIYVYPNDVWGEEKVYVSFLSIDPETADQPDPVYIGEQETRQYLTDKGIDIDRCIRFGYVYAGDEPVYAVKGDFNNNGSVDAMDAQIVLDNALMQLMDTDAAVIPGADLDGDGEVTPSDAQIVLNYYVMNSVISIPTDWADLI